MKKAAGKASEAIVVTAPNKTRQVVPQFDLIRFIAKREVIVRANIK